MSEETKLTGPVGWAWAPYHSEGNQVLHDVLVVGSVQRFYDEGPCYGQALGNRTGPISTDTAAREIVESRALHQFSNFSRLALVDVVNEEELFNRLWPEFNTAGDRRGWRGAAWAAWVARGAIAAVSAEAVSAAPQHRAGEVPISSRELIQRCGGDPDAPFAIGPFPPEMREPSPLLATSTPEAVKVFTVGERTMEAVFRPSDFTNLSDLQAVLNAVERALELAAASKPPSVPVHSGGDQPGGSSTASGSKARNTNEFLVVGSSTPAPAVETGVPEEERASRLIAAIEGELDGLCCGPEAAKEILAYVDTGLAPDEPPTVPTSVCVPSDSASVSKQPAPPPSHDVPDAPMAEGKTALSHSLLAERCAYLAKVAAAWAGDLLSLPEQNGAPVPVETVERFLSEMRERLDRIELAGSSRGNG